MLSISVSVYFMLTACAEGAIMIGIIASFRCICPALLILSFIIPLFRGLVEGWLMRQLMRQFSHILHIEPSRVLVDCGSDMMIGILKRNRPYSYFVELRKFMIATITETFSHNPHATYADGDTQTTAPEYVIHRIPSNTLLPIISRLSHELNTSLAAVLGSAQILHQSTDANNVEQKQLVQIILHCSKVMANQVSDFLDVAQCQQNQLVLSRKMFSLPSMLEKLRLAFEGEARRLQIAIEFVVPVMPQPVVIGDSARVEQILTNLLCNAVQAFESGRSNNSNNSNNKILLQVQEAAAGEQGGHLRKVQFTLTDNGCGIPEAEQANLFVPFYQLPSAGGTNALSSPRCGLGLCICRYLVRLVGGEIEIKSSVGVGTTVLFFMYLEAASTVIDVSSFAYDAAVDLRTRMARYPVSARSHPSLHHSSSHGSIYPQAQRKLPHNNSSPRSLITSPTAQASLSSSRRIPSHVSLRATVASDLKKVGSKDAITKQTSSFPLAKVMTDDSTSSSEQSGGALPGRVNTGTPTGTAGSRLPVVSFRLDRDRQRSTSSGASDSASQSTTAAQTRKSSSGSGSDSTGTRGMVVAFPLSAPPPPPPPPPAAAALHELTSESLIITSRSSDPAVPCFSIVHPVNSTPLHVSIDSSDTPEDDLRFAAFANLTSIRRRLLSATPSMAVLSRESSNIYNPCKSPSSTYTDSPPASPFPTSMSESLGVNAFPQLTSLFIPSPTNLRSARGAPATVTTTAAAATQPFTPIPLVVVCVDDNLINRMLLKRMVALVLRCEVVCYEKGSEVLEEVQRRAFAGDSVVAATNTTPAVTAVAAAASTSTATTTSSRGTGSSGGGSGTGDVHGLVLTDIHMPEIDGTELTRQLRCRYSANVLPIVGVTADHTASLSEECLACGMQAVITKPVLKEHLVDTIMGLIKVSWGEDAARHYFKEQ